MVITNGNQGIGRGIQAGGVLSLVTTEHSLDGYHTTRWQHWVVHKMAAFKATFRVRSDYNGWLHKFVEISKYVQ